MIINTTIIVVNGIIIYNVNIITPFLMYQLTIQLIPRILYWMANDGI